jgi:type IV pilus assembly protein PilC
MSNQFSNYECYSIKIGEETGGLCDILKELVIYYTKKVEQKRKITTALSYPIFIFTIAIVAVIFMMIVVVPMFQDVFARFGNELPYLTQLIINISNAITDNIEIIILIITSIIIGYIASKNNIKFAKIKAKFILNLPFFGELTRKMYLARFSLAMALLTSAHIPILQSIRLLKKMIEFYPIKISLEVIEKDMMKGKSFHESLSQFNIYDKKMISLVKVGEEVNQLYSVFNRLKNQYMEEVDYQTSMISNILEPLMIIFVGIFVGIILVSMYLPIFKLSTSFGY